MMTVDLNDQMNQFRIASRELFNHFFRMYYSDEKEQLQAWVYEERFSDVEELLFQKLVSEPFLLENVCYGYPQPDIWVVPDSELECGVPISLNRGQDSGSWDYPLDRINKDSRLLFISFFDWDQLGYRGNMYVCIRIDDSSAHPDIIGKDGLIQANHVRFVKGTQAVGGNDRDR